eukprot:6478298-Amphidinium_carterae.3
MDVKVETKNPALGAIKLLKQSPIVGKFVQVCKEPSTTKEKLFSAAKTLVKDLRKEWGENAEKECLPASLLTKANTALGKSSG